MRLKIENLSVTLSKQSILEDLSLDVNDGELLALLGPSGCGKSTLLKSIAGLLEISSGEIFIGEKRVNDLLPEKRRAVIVFQDLRLFPHLSVEKNIRFAMELAKKSEQHMQEQVESLLDLVQLPGFEKRKIKQLSGGQMQRVALARALASEPDVLLLDEPFSGLDERLREDMADLVRNIQKEKNITTILVTHDKSEALRMADRIALMKSGVILQIDEPKIIYNEPNSLEVAEYFGKINQIDGKLVRPSRLKLSHGDAYEIVELSFLGERVEIVLEKVCGEQVFSDNNQSALDESVNAEQNRMETERNLKHDSKAYLQAKSNADFAETAETNDEYGTIVGGASRLRSDAVRLYATMDSDAFYANNFQKGSRVNVEVV